MEPVTHFLTGAVLARTGLNRRAASMTAAMTLAAEFPDIDTLWSLGGPLTGFEHHRGITHTFLAVPLEAALITAAFFLYHRLRPRKTKTPPNWPWLFCGCLIALLSHLLLDWTNNYGLRPFFPFNPHWYAGSFVFIIEPALLAILILALLGPWLGGLIGGEIGAQKPPFRGRPSAIAACCAIAALYVFRFNQHSIALNLAQTNTPEATRVYASPHPLDPFTWSTVADTPQAYQLATLNTRTGLAAPATPADSLPKPPTTLALLAAKRSRLGRIYLDWSSYPVLTETPVTEDPQVPFTEITFSDARFMYNVLTEHGRDTPPITGSVLLNMQSPEGQRIQQTTFNNKEQK